MQMFVAAARASFVRRVRQQFSLSSLQRQFPRALSSRKFSSPARVHESFITGTGGAYVEELFEAWEKDPNSVHKSWQVFFANLQANAQPGAANALPPSLTGGIEPVPVEVDQVASAAVDHMNLLLLVRAFQVRGHYLAHLDPLEINTANIHMQPDGQMPQFLDHKTYGFTDADLDREFYMGAAAIGAAAAGVLASGRPQTLREIIDTLKGAYCDTIGVEFMHIPDLEQQNWIRDKFEKSDKFQHTKSDVLNMYDRLAFASNFETFLATKYGVTKRFGLEGVESAIPGIKSMIDRAAELGCEAFNIGMPHRGRLNVLANVMRKPMEEIFQEFIAGTVASVPGHDEVWGSGDVKYHLGFSIDRPTTCGKRVHLSLVANPSHLEAVNPVVLGKTRAKQESLKDDTRRRAMSVLLHGDAAFAGQGIVYETLELSDIKGYSTGGTVHIIVNNQIGFTTDPRFARSSPYCSDVAKCVSVPIFHVNADDLQAVCWVCATAAEFRQKFGKDVIVDIVGYRRYGHNEIDEPSFTQPLMYQHISKTKPVLQKFQDEALEKSLLSKDEIDKVEADCVRIFEQAFEKARRNVESGTWDKGEIPLENRWKGFKSRFSFSARQDTGVPLEELRNVGERLSSYPKDFHIHRGLARVMQNKKHMFDTGVGLDWATAEALAFGTLLKEGVHVRLSGQDVERGTFSHRHAVLHDQENESKYVPLQNLSSDQATFSIFNSNLSEYGVLGFELGYSLHSPMSLVLWEAQFGDFANTAQVIIDQFIAAGEQKWLRQSGLVMLLPHGYEGQGPEHSSARIERFLQMSDDDPAIIPEMAQHGRMQIQHSNWQIVNLSTPANYFHALRRQIRREFRKPLVVFSPKSLLRHPQCVSDIQEFVPGIPFRRMIDERFPHDIVAPEEVKRLILCTGKVYYDVIKYRNDNQIKNIAVATLEQISPFPFDRVQQLSKKYPNAELVWVQEEPQNMGCWSYVEPRVATALLEINGKRISYIGRNPAASPATGNSTIHLAEIEQFLEAAFNLAPAPDRMPPIRWRY
mmetsp:Transcript_44400/g.140112  ORF Transcript_44400/g.140112 Transcript_44400/m.140112 type:complete len:1033 (-) Transcript_44400:65-3163(-)